MIGYLQNNKDFFKGNVFEYNLKKAVAFSGGNKKHYEFFKLLLTPSVYNNSTRRPLHDARAAQFLLHLFPIKMQALLSILFYQYEQNLSMEFSSYAIDTQNILLPSQQLQYNNIVSKNSIADSLLFILDDVVRQNLFMNDVGLAEVKKLFNIPFTVNDLDGTLTQNVNTLLTKFRVPTISKTQYFNIVKDNNRLDSAIITARYLNYKTQSIQYLTEAVSTWHQNLST